MSGPWIVNTTISFDDYSSELSDDKYDELKDKAPSYNTSLSFSYFEPDPDVGIMDDYMEFNYWEPTNDGESINQDVKEAIDKYLSYEDVINRYAKKAFEVMYDYFGILDIKHITFYL